MRMNLRSKTFFLVLAILIAPLLWIFAPPGCASMEDVQSERSAALDRKKAIDDKIPEAEKDLAALREQYAKLLDQKRALELLVADLRTSDEERTRAKAVLDDLDPKVVATGKAAGEISGAIDDAKKKSAAIDRNVKDVDHSLDTIDQPNPGTTLGTLVGTFFPGAGVLAPVIAGMGYRMVKLAQSRRRLASDNVAQGDALSGIVKSIDALARVAPEVASALSTHKGMVDGIQGPTTKAIVDQVQAGIPPAINTAKTATV